MDFNLDSEQTALGDTVRKILKPYLTDAEKRRTVVSQAPGFDEEIWQHLAEMGVIGLPFDEDYHGMGAGPVELAVVAEEIGKALAPEPFIDVVVLAGGLIEALGTTEQCDELMPGICQGEVFPAFAYDEPAGRWTLAAGGVTATRDGDGWRLHGVKEPVPEGGRADVLLVSAPVEDQTGVFIVQATDTEVTDYGAYDGGRAARIKFSHTPATLLGGEPAPDRKLSAVIANAQVAACHEMVGAMETALEMTCSYLKTRKQFGVTLNKFQALTFRAADMYTSLELARSIAWWATMVLSTEDPGHLDPVTVAARAKLQVGKAARHIGQEAIQLHGGIGMTDEYPVGHYTARLTALDHFLGDGRTQKHALTSDLAEHGVLDPQP